MKLTTVIFLLVTIMGGMCTKTSYQPKLTPGLTTKDKLSQSHMGKALVNMIQLGNTVEADFDELYEALNLLKESLTKKKQAESADFRADGETHRLNVSRLTRLINTYDNEAIIFEDELDVLVAEGLSLTGTLKNQQGQLKTAETQEESEEGILEKLTDNYDSQSRDYQEAIELLNEAIGKLNEARASQGLFGSFLETNKSTFKSLSERITTTLVNLKAKSTVSKPIAQFFAQLTTSEPSSATIGRAIEALENLREYFEEGLTGLKGVYDESTAEHTNLLNQIRVQIGNLSQVIIPKTQSDLESNQEAQGIRTDQLTEAQRNSRVENGNLEAENESFEKRVELHELLMPQYDEEYAIVEQAEILLRQQE